MPSDGTQSAPCLTEDLQDMRQMSWQRVPCRHACGLMMRDQHSGKLYDLSYTRATVAVSY